MIDSIIDEHFGGYSVVRADYLQITGDACAAQILHSLEYWTAHRFREIERIEQQNAEAIKNGGQITPVPSEWLYEKIQTFVDAICGTFKRNKVIEALKLLKNKGFIESKPSSIPRDQTLLYRFNIEKVEQSLREAKASKGFSSKRKAKTQSLDINDESLNLNRQSLDLNSVQSSDLNSDLYIIHDLNIQVLNSKDPLTPKGGTGCLSEEGGVEGQPPERGLREEPPQTPVSTPIPESDRPEQKSISSEDQTPPAPTPIFSVHKKEHQDRIVQVYQSNKPNAWLPVNNLHRDIRVMVDSLLSSENFQGDLEAFLTRLESALKEVNDPTTKFGWFRNQGNLGLRTLLSNYGRHLMEISDRWMERQTPQVRSDALPDWALEAQKEIEARQIKKAG